MTRYRRSAVASAALAAALLMLPLLFLSPPATAATTRALAITTESAGPQVPFQAFDGNPPKVFDIDGDGRLEIIAQNDNQWVYVFDSLTGEILFEARTTFPPGWTARSFNGPEVSILTEDGKVRLVVANSAATITVYRFDPTVVAGKKLAFVKEWERRLTDCYSNPAMDSKPVFADLDLDGRLEIVATTEESGIFALRFDGRVLWKRCIGGGNAEPGIGDLDRDGYPDVVHANDGGTVTALRGPSGTTMWSYFVPGVFNVGTGSMPVAPTVAQLDGLGGPDVVVGVRDSHDATNWTNDHALLLALDHQGRLLWGRQDPLGNPLTYTRPIVVDADEDGAAEVYWGDWNTNGHKPPFTAADQWKVTGPGRFYRYDAAGTLAWRQSLPTWWSNKDLALADVDADGVQEVLANGPAAGGHDGIWYLDSATGAKEAFVDVDPWKVQRGPIVADLWGLGTMQWVLPAGPNSPSAGGPAILVYDTGVLYDSAWPHVPYAERGAPPPPPSGEFNATFTIKSPNAWWQEVTIKAEEPRTITKVQVRTSGEVWRPMSKASWGAWTSSYHTPAGTRVEFLATDSGGAVSQSAPFTWLDGTLTQRNVPAGGGEPPPSTFTATFQVSSSANEWWVEVAVTASEPLAAVHVSVEGGAWTALSPTDWGTWAKSFFVAQGSRVVFRATSVHGEEAQSEEVRWLSDGAPFSATFQLGSGINNWWVEVKVTANYPVKAVDARVNGGSWIALELKSWGAWAKSFHVASGSTVEFQAADADGATVLSDPYTWP